MKILKKIKLAKINRKKVFKAYTLIKILMLIISKSKYKFKMIVIKRLKNLF